MNACDEIFSFGPAVHNWCSPTLPDGSACLIAIVPVSKPIIISLQPQSEDGDSSCVGKSFRCCRARKTPPIIPRVKHDTIDNLIRIIPDARIDPAWRSLSPDAISTTLRTFSKPDASGHIGLDPCRLTVARKSSDEGMARSSNCARSWLLLLCFSLRFDRILTSPNLQDRACF